MNKNQIFKINKQYGEYKKNRKVNNHIEIDLQDFSSFTTNSVGRKIRDFPSKVVIIVPFREPEDKPGIRTEQLNKFIEHYYNFGPDYNPPRILIIEQSKDGKGFNRGALLNIGFDIARLSNPDIYIFHDVDLLSSEELIPLYYTKPLYPTHIARLWKEKYNFYTFFGGIVSFNKKDFEKSNGFPNNIFGWGLEDTISYNRLVINHIPIITPVSENKNLIIEMNAKNTDDKPSIEAKKILLEDFKTWDKNGINDVKYKEIQFKELKENIYKITVKLL
jgi:hypothetical protein